MSDSSVKKNLMYLSGEDFYLFCYAIFVVLDALGCKKDKFFKDYRKLAFLIEFLKDEKLNYIISRGTDKKLNPVDKEYLFNSYSVGLSRRSEILKLLFTLEKRKYIKLEKGNTRSVVNVSLNDKEIPEYFLNKDVFSKEYKNINEFRKKIQRLSSLTLDTMLKQIYEENEIQLWAV